MDKRQVRFDDTLNDLGWKAVEWFRDQGTQLSGGAFNGMKSFLRDCIQQWVDAQPKPPSASGDRELPPLPHTSACIRHEDICGDEVGPPDFYYTADQMRAYARAALAPSPGIDAAEPVESVADAQPVAAFKAAFHAASDSGAGYDDAIAAGLAANPQPSSNPGPLEAALRLAEAALSDIGDAAREPGDDVAWCERRAAQALPAIRAAITAIEPSGSVGELSDAARDVLAERHRQIAREDYTYDHDDEHVNDEIAALACFYAMPPAARAWDATSTGYGATLGNAILPPDWQTSTGSRRRELIKAGALVLAELERMDRAAIAATEGDAS